MYMPLYILSSTFAGHAMPRHAMLLPLPFNFTFTFYLSWTFAGHQWASHQVKKPQNKTQEVFFHAAFDFDAPRPQNTDKKWNNNQF